MNSKESLERIGLAYVPSEDRDLMFSDLYGKYYDIIEKDLEIFESYKKAEEDLGIDIKLLAKLKSTDYVVFRYDFLSLDGVVEDISILDGTIRVGRPYDKKNPNACGWEHLDIRLPEEYNSITLQISDLGKSWWFQE